MKNTRFTVRPENLGQTVIVPNDSSTSNGSRVKVPRPCLLPPICNPLVLHLLYVRVFPSATLHEYPFLLPSVSSVRSRLDTPLNKIYLVTSILGNYPKGWFPIFLHSYKRYVYESISRTIWDTFVTFWLTERVCIVDYTPSDCLFWCTFALKR